MSASVSGAYASAHLPECTLPKGWGDCICTEIRAAYKRGCAFAKGEAIEHYEQGYAAGVQAARDAVDVALLGTLQPTRDRALAAIDALKEEP